jgi:hypothetical protein
MLTAHRMARFAHTARTATYRPFGCTRVPSRTRFTPCKFSDDHVVAFNATSEQERVTRQMVDEAFKYAAEQCYNRPSGECAALWDAAYEIYTEYVHQKEKRRLAAEWALQEQNDDSWESRHERRTYDL